MNSPRKHRPGGKRRHRDVAALLLLVATVMVVAPVAPDPNKLPAAINWMLLPVVWVGANVAPALFFSIPREAVPAPALVYCLVALAFFVLGYGLWVGRRWSRVGAATWFASVGLHSWYVVLQQGFAWSLQDPSFGAVLCTVLFLDVTAEDLVAAVKKREGKKSGEG